MRPILSVFCFAFGLLPIAGCQTIIGADFDSAELAPVSKAGPPTCKLAKALVRPDDLPKASDSVDFTVVLNQLDFGDNPSDSGGAPVGYDLDGLCTREGGPPSCEPYPWFKPDLADGPEGRDDSVGGLFAAQKRILGQSLIGTTEENENIAAGLIAPTGVLRVRGFSGLASDDHVTVELFQAAALSAADPPGEAGAAPRRPAFDATDHWPVVRDTLEAGGALPLESTQRDDDAFVMGSTLVAHFDTVRLPMRGVYIQAVDIVLTGRPHIDPIDGWTIQDGTIAGKVHSDALLAFIPLATRAVVNVSLCTNDDLNYKLAKSLLCQAADLPEKDGDPKTPCTYASIGLNFQSSPASLGGVVDPAPLENPCPPETDPAMDHCSIE